MDDDIYTGYVIICDDLDYRSRQRMETALHAAHPDRDWQVREPQTGEALGTYARLSNGNLQILGYTIPMSEDIERIISEAWERALRSKAARTLGSIKSERKASASRANGRLGGRPRGVLTTRSRIEARWTSDPADLENRASIPGSPEAVGSPRQVFTAVREYKHKVGSAFCCVEYRHHGRILTREEITDLETAVMLAEQKSRE